MRVVSGTPDFLVRVRMRMCSGLGRVVVIADSGGDYSNGCNSAGHYSDDGHGAQPGSGAGSGSTRGRSSARCSSLSSHSAGRYGKQ
jgi:hypothetical protein